MSKTRCRTRSASRLKKIPLEPDTQATLPSKEEAALNLLAFESSAKAASAALLSDGCLLAEYTQNSGQTHSRTLMELAKNMITGCDLTPQDIDAVAVAGRARQLYGCAYRHGLRQGLRVGAFSFRFTVFRHWRRWCAALPAPTAATAPVGRAEGPDLQRTV